MIIILVKSNITKQDRQFISTCNQHFGSYLLEYHKQVVNENIIVVLSVIHKIMCNKKWFFYYRIYFIITQNNLHIILKSEI